MKNFGIKRLSSLAAVPKSRLRIQLTHDRTLRVRVFGIHSDRREDILT
jgi:hypothetical protein